MTELKNKITSPQLFCLIFCYMFAGFRLHGGAGIAATLAICLFCVCICVICAAAGKCFGSFRELCRAALGKGAFVLVLFALVLVALPFAFSLWEMTKGAANFYENAKTFAIAAALALLCALAVSRGFGTVGRFAELCVFPLAILLPLSLLGGGGEMPHIGFMQGDAGAFFAAVGCVPVFLSLYLCLARSSEKSDFARASSFAPSPVLCGAAGVLSAGALHLILVYTGAGSVLSSFFVWFLCLGRLFVFALSAGEALK